MQESKDILRDNVTNMLGVEKHILETVERQTRDRRTRLYKEGYDLLLKTQSTLNAHILELERCLSSIDGSSYQTYESMIKKAASAAMGAMTGLYDRIRMEEGVSKDLRDVYTSLNLAAVSYSMLHTTALALDRSEVAELAFRHMTDLTPIIVEFSRIIPIVLAKELADEGKAIDAAIGQQAVANTQRAWSHEVVGH